MNEPIITKRPKKRKQPKFKQLGLILFTLTLMALIVFGAYKFFFPAEEEFVLDFYTYSIVDTRDFLETLNASGTVKPEQVLEIKPEIDGEIVEVFAVEGQDVLLDEPLFRLHSDNILEQYEVASHELQQAEKNLIEIIDTYEFKLFEAKQAVQEAKDQIKTKEANLELQTVLYNLGTIARVDFTKADKELNDAKHSLVLAERELENTLKSRDNEVAKANENLKTLSEELAKLNKQIDSFIVKAPIAGKILDFNATLNQNVTSSSVLGQIADLNSQYVELQITPAQAERFTIGSAADINTGQSSYSGEVSYISAQARQSNDGALVTVRITFDDPVSNIRPHSNVTANVHLGIYKDSMFLPRGAYLTSGQQLFVYVLEEERAIQRDVQFGLLQGNYIQIFSGLTVGDKVITSSYDQYRHLEEIKVFPEGGRKI